MYNMVNRSKTSKDMSTTSKTTVLPTFILGRLSSLSAKPPSSNNMTAAATTGHPLALFTVPKTQDIMILQCIIKLMWTLPGNSAYPNNIAAPLLMKGM
jgi:hypothetical protein